MTKKRKQTQLAATLERLRVEVVEAYLSVGVEITKERANLILEQRLNEITPRYIEAEIHKACRLEFEGEPYTETKPIDDDPDS